MFSQTTLLALTAFLSTVSAHGAITSPTPRSAGSAMKSACGQQVYDNQESDSYGNIQGILQVASSQSDYDAAACDVWLCKGYKYADNTANVQSYTAGQVIPITVDIRAPHTGTANVSIVDTATNTMISDTLAYWSVYASTSTTIPANDTSFSITMPEDLGDKCDTAGACVIQWWWNAASIDQTYESCIDFTLGGSGSSSNTTTAATTSVAASSSKAATSAAAAATSSSAATTSSVATSIISKLAGNAAATSSFSATAVPTTLQTSVSSAKTTATSTTTSSSSTSTATVAAMPAGTTLEDILSWLNSYLTALMK